MADIETPIDHTVDPETHRYDTSKYLDLDKENPRYGITPLGQLAAEMYERFAKLEARIKAIEEKGVDRMGFF